jgi:lipopolysaccharide export LptBFGC system permease protein LptF
LEYAKGIEMWKLGLALIGCIIFAVLFSLGDASGAAGNLVYILFTAFAALFIVVVAISIAPWLSKRGR